MSTTEAAIGLGLGVLLWHWFQVRGNHFASAQTRATGYRHRVLINLVFLRDQLCFCLAPILLGLVVYAGTGPVSAMVITLGTLGGLIGGLVGRVVKLRYSAVIPRVNPWAAYHPRDATADEQEIRR